MESVKLSRCNVCNKKTLIGINCSCGLYVCMFHRHPEDHNCKNNEKIMLNDKEKLRQRIMKQSTKILKLEKI